MIESASKLLWQGAVPVRITLSPKYQTTLGESPEPFYAMIPRHGYLSTLVNPLKSHFERFTTQLPGMRVRVWLQVVSEVSENKVVDDAIVTPVKWHLPAGVLYDTLWLSAVNDSLQCRPWELIVHFGNFPEQGLIDCNDETLMRATFMHALKEAIFMEKGSTQPFTSLTVTGQNQIWAGVWTSQLSLYTEGIHSNPNTRGRDLLPFGGHEDSLVVKDDIPRRVPVRIHTTSKGAIQSFLPCCCPYREDGSVTTVAHVLEEVLPTSIGTYDRSGSCTLVVVQGIVIDVSLAVGWIWSVFCHPDHFLHIIVKET